jgi:hypothetical protein
VNARLTVSSCKATIAKGRAWNKRVNAVILKKKYNPEIF